MQLIVSHPTGNRNVRAIVESIFQEKMLAEFNTTLAINPASSFIKLLPAGVRNELLRRVYPIPMNKVNSHPWREIARMILPKIGLRRYTSNETSYASIDAVYKTLDSATAKRLSLLNKKRAITAVYAYEDGAFATFTMAKQLGIKCIYDLPIAFWETSKKLMSEEAERLPEWACTFKAAIKDSDEKLERKSEELSMADMIIAPGSFVYNSLPSWSKNKAIHIAPFGTPFSCHEPLSKKSGITKRPLRVLFAGSMSQRKGLGDLFAAMRILNTPDIELIVMGSLHAPLEFYRSDFAHFTYEPGRSNAEVLLLMKSCDVFCLPSIVEGRALVMQEAMSQGLPLIITANTGGEDLIIEGETGFLVPIRSPASIAGKLSWFLENRSKIPEMGVRAQRHAAQYTWSKYGTDITSAIKKLPS